MVFGESMFAHVTNASKIAMCALVAFCLAHEITVIDCQQKTVHLASLGAEEISRIEFTSHLAQSISQPAPTWQFDPVYWYLLMPLKTTPTP
jgi:leucyl/phenylalanyl-tRNA--protein transferase